MTEIHVNIDGYWEEENLELQEILERLDLDNPDESGLDDLREYMIANPESYKYIFDYAGAIQYMLIKSSYDDPILQLSIKSNVECILREMGYKQAPILERLIMDNIVNWWLRLQLLELGISEMHNSNEHSLEAITSQEERLGVTQNRFLRACMALVRIRKITSQTPGLQFNIAADKGQQVNIAGDQAKSGTKQ